MSRPVWARGLKQWKPAHVVPVLLSRPVWARGLKLLNIYKKWKTKNVAPRVGAWIETPMLAPVMHRINVAPRVGAWIETER